MKAHLLAIAAFGAATLLSGADLHAQAADVAFTGKMTATTCAVSARMVGGAASGSGDVTVTLRRVSSAALDQAGRRPSGYRSDIEITVGSPTQPCLAKVVRPTFSGANINAAGRLSTVGGAANVDLVLIDASGADQDIDLRTQTNVRAVDIPTGVGTAALRYAVEYYATGQATAGTLISEIQYDLEYN